MLTAFLQKRGQFFLQKVQKDEDDESLEAQKQDAGSFSTNGNFSEGQMDERRGSERKGEWNKTPGSLESEMTTCGRHRRRRRKKTEEKETEMKDGGNSVPEENKS